MTKRESTGRPRAPRGVFRSHREAHAFACTVAWDHLARVTVLQCADGWCVVDMGTPRCVGSAADVAGVDAEPNLGDHEFPFD